VGISIVWLLATRAAMGNNAAVPWPEPRSFPQFGNRALRIPLKGLGPPSCYRLRSASASIASRFLFGHLEPMMW